MKQPPETIYLQCNDDDGNYIGGDPDIEVTWCADAINDSDTEYVRADKLSELEAENARLKAALEATNE